MNIPLATGFVTEDATGPLPVTGHKIVCARNDGIFLVGGWNPDVTDGNWNSALSYIRTVWKLNFSTKKWKECLSDGFDNTPDCMDSHCLWFLNDSQLLVLAGPFAPFGIEGNSNRIYLYHINRDRINVNPWEEIECRGDEPPEDVGHWRGQASFLDRHEGFLYVSSGVMPLDNNFVAINRLNIQNWTWEKLADENTLNGPCGCYCHEIIVHNGTLYLLGGSTDFERDSLGLDQIFTFSLNNRSWTLLQTLPDPNLGIYPSARCCFSCILYDHSAYVYGGLSIQEDQSSVLGDLWKLDLTTFQWTRISDDLPPLWYHSADVTPEGCMYVFGGCVTEAYYGDRSSDVIRIRLNTPSLQDRCWEVLLGASRKTLENLDDHTLHSIGIPTEFLKRLRF